MLKTVDGANNRPASVINRAQSVNRPPSVQNANANVQAPSKYNMNSVTYGMRTRPPSTPQRKLGRTRKFHKFNCEICEKAQLKKHIWDISK